MALTDKWRTEWDRELRLLPQVESIADHDLQITEDIFFIWQFLKMYHTSMPHVRNLIDFITTKKPESLIWGEHIDDYMFRGIDKGQKLFNLLVSDGKRIQPRYSKKKLCDTLLYFRLKNYIILEKINTGSVGQVHLALDKSTDTLVAAKAIDKSTVQGDEELFQKLKEEISISCRMNHPCVVKTTNVLETRDKIIQIMEYCDGGDLISYVRNKLHLEELSAQYFFRKIVQGLQYMHRNNVSHRDLKPENIFLCKRQLSQREKTLIRIGKLPSCSEYELKIGDFGACCVNEKNKLHHDIVGTLSYAAPEVLGCNTTCGYSSQKADVWSLGIILYAMLFGLLPFDNEGKNLKDAYNAIIKNKIVYPKHRINKISMNARNLLSGMLTINPDNRLSLDEVVNHEWLADTGKTKLEVSHVHKKMNFPISSTVACPVGSGKNDMDFETFKKLFLIKRENGPSVTNIRVPGVVASKNGMLINMVPGGVQNVVSGRGSHGIPCAAPFGAPYGKPYESATLKENDQVGASPRSGNEKGQACHLRGSNSLVQRSDPHHLRQNQNLNQNHGQFYLYDDKGVLNTHVNNPNGGQHNVENPVYADAPLAQKEKQGKILDNYALNQKCEEEGNVLMGTKKKQTNDGNNKINVCTQKGITNHRRDHQNNYYVEKTYFKNNILDNTYLDGKSNNHSSSVNYYDGKKHPLEYVEENKLKVTDQVNKNPHVNPHLFAKTNNTYDLYFNKNDLYRNQSNNIFLLPCKDNLMGKNNLYSNLYSNLYLFKGGNDFNVTTSGRSTLLRHYDQGKLTTNREYDTGWKFKYASNASDGRESTNTITSSCTNVSPNHNNAAAIEKMNASPGDALFYENPNYNNHPVRYKYYYYDDKGTYVGCLSNQTSGRTCASSCVLLENQVNYAANNGEYTKEWTYKRGVSEYVETGTASNYSNNNNASSSDRKREDLFVKHPEGEGHTKLASYEWGKDAAGALFVTSENRGIVMEKQTGGASKQRNDLTSANGHPRIVQQVGRSTQVGGQMGEHANRGITEINPMRDTLLTDGSITSKVSTPTKNDAELQLRPTNYKGKDTCIILKKEGITHSANKHSSLIKSQHATKIVTIGESTCDQMDLACMQINELKGNPKESHQKENKFTLNLLVQKGRIKECTKMDRTEEKNISRNDYTDEQSNKWNTHSGEKDDRVEFLPSGGAPAETCTSNTQKNKLNNNTHEEVNDAIQRDEGKTEKDNQRETHKGDNNSPEKIASPLPVKDENKNVTSEEGSNTPGKEHTEGECKDTPQQSYSDGSETKTKKKKKKKIFSINNPSKEIQRRQSKSDPSGDDKQVNQVDKKKYITNSSRNNNRSCNYGQKHSCEENYNSGTRSNHNGTDTAVVAARKSSSNNEGEKNKVDKRRERVIESAIEKYDMPKLSKRDSHVKEKTDAAEFRCYPRTEKTCGHLEGEKKLCKNEEGNKQRENTTFNEEQIDGKNKFLLLKKLYYSNDRDLHVLPNRENQHDKKRYINFEKIFPHRKRKTNTTHIPPLSYYNKSNLCFSKRVKKDRKERGEENEDVVKNQVDVSHRAHNRKSKNDITNIRHFSEWYYTNGCNQHELTTKGNCPSKEGVPIYDKVATYDEVAPYDEERVSDKECVYFSSNKIEYIKCATRNSINQDSHQTYGAHYYNHMISETNRGVSNPVSDAHVVSADKCSTKCSDKRHIIWCTKEESQNYMSKNEKGISYPTVGFNTNVEKCSLPHEPFLFNGSGNGNVIPWKNNLPNQMGSSHLSSSCPSEVKPTLSLASYYNEKGVNDMGEVEFTSKDTEKATEWGEKPMQPGHNLNAILDRNCEKSSTYNRGDIESGRCIPNLEGHIFQHSPIDQSIKVNETEDNEEARTERSPSSAENSGEGYSPEEVGSANVSTSNDSNGITTKPEELSGVPTSDATNNPYIGNNAIKRGNYTSLYDDVKKSYSIIQNVSYKHELTKEKMKNKNGERIITRWDAKEQIWENGGSEQAVQIHVKGASPTEHPTPKECTNIKDPAKSTTMKMSQNHNRPMSRKKERSGEDDQDKSAKCAGMEFTPLTLKKDNIWKNSPSNPENCYGVEFPTEFNGDLSEGSLDRDKSQTHDSSANRKDTHLLVKDEGKDPHLDTQHIYMMNANLKKQKPQGEKEKHERYQKGSVHNGPTRWEDPPHELTSSRTNEEVTKNKKETTLKESTTEGSKHLASCNIWNVEKNGTIHSKQQQEDYLTHNRSYDLKSARSNLFSMSYDENVRKDYTHGNILVNPEDISSIHNLKSCENDEKNKMLYYYNLDTTQANLDFLNNLMFYSSHINPYRHYKNRYLTKKSSLTGGVNLTNSKQNSGNNRTEKRRDHQNEPLPVDHNLRNYLNLNKTSIQNLAKMKRNYIREQNYENKFGTKMDDQREANTFYPKLRWMNIFSRNSSKY
ncbi:CAMK/CAMKL protein kinase [Plasmodium coatneyi]|uniref:CAMK/CAMKL protein kinase n=1 Tax=Plasmodium coatneyi TaxID=208452 RepID=A0A1B1E5S2_9APIC|nr:CAMK/CAMKL protein kinase [Plasmodium coatneyi]ANQ10382.1 CAMK/CAMKL protein kinase [Plasmodium coatneyi]